jgi:uncharacterized protein YodC (DUF2158 family)
MPIQSALAKSELDGLFILNRIAMESIHVTQKIFYSFRTAIPAFNIVQRIVNKIFVSRSFFVSGQSVQLKNGGELMVVQRIHFNKKMHEPFIECKWFDRTSQSTKTNIFPEKDLKNFDWYHTDQ